MTNAIVEVGFQVFTADGDAEVGAVRAVHKDSLLVYIENGGDFTVPAAAVSAVHSQKVVLDVSQLSPELATAIAHAHDKEERGV